LRQAGGRLELTELPALVGVDLVHCERQVRATCSATCHNSSTLSGEPLSLPQDSSTVTCPTLTTCTCWVHTTQIWSAGLPVTTHCSTLQSSLYLPAHNTILAASLLVVLPTGCAYCGRCQREYPGGPGRAHHNAVL
jgi:hypothetical protein